MAPDLGELYAASRNRISDLVLSSPPGAGANPCPATPGWTVHDVVAHLRGVTEDVRTGNLEGVATPPWTAAQVERHRTDSMEQLVNDWAEDAALVEAVLSSPQGGAVARAVIDIYTHEADVRGGLDRVLHPPQLFLDWALPACTEPFFAAVAGTGATPLQIMTDDGDHLGPADATVTLRVNRFELFRALLGRRSEAQVRAFDWGGADPGPYLEHFFIFGPRQSDLVEL